jgi:hypothetical protein
MSISRMPCAGAAKADKKDGLTNGISAVQGDSGFFSFHELLASFVKLLQVSMPFFLVRPSLMR